MKHNFIYVKRIVDFDMCFIRNIENVCYGVGVIQNWCFIKVTIVIQKQYKLGIIPKGYFQQVPKLV
jgi:hypothetical protein